MSIESVNQQFCSSCGKKLNEYERYHQMIQCAKCLSEWIFKHPNQEFAKFVAGDVDLSK